MNHSKRRSEAGNGTVIFLGSVLGLFLLCSFIQYVMETYPQQNQKKALRTLRTISKAQNIFRTEKKTYAANLKELSDAGLLDPEIATSNPKATVDSYYFGNTQGDQNSFCAFATRESDISGFNDLSIDETGTVRLNSRKSQPQILKRGEGFIQFDDIP